MEGKMKSFLSILIIFSFLLTRCLPMDQDNQRFERDLIVGGLPGQPYKVEFRQYAGYINVDVTHGRRLFYYFVESSGQNPTSKPVVLWLNGGPGCSSIGVGAMVEHGPFGVERDSKTLYARTYSWNKAASMLYLESPVGVGFSYTNNISDYDTMGDSRTLQDSYTFLVKWFQRFPHFRRSEFYIAGESYAGVYIPLLAARILENMNTHPFQLKGIAVGNGMTNVETDLKGTYDFMYFHALISKETHQGLLDNCLESSSTSLCLMYQNVLKMEIGDVDLYSVNSDTCEDLNGDSAKGCQDFIDPCVKNYVIEYLNLPEVQEALHVDHALKWPICRGFKSWDGPGTVLPIYQTLMKSGLRVLLYSGDMDGVVPWTSTLYSIEAMNLTVKFPWRPWYDENHKVGGHKVEYVNLTFATVRGAGHEVPKYQPQRAFSLYELFILGMSTW